MTDLAILGAGAFGTALAVALSDRPVTLWARDGAHADEMKNRRENMRRLAGVPLTRTITVTSELDTVAAETVLLAMPMQELAVFLQHHGKALKGRVLVACAKGVDRKTELGPVATVRVELPGTQVAMLTGPSFAADIARGLPTALTLACADDDVGRRLQHRLSTPVLRLYRTTDVAGAELGGALKNVIAIAAGIVVGAGLGDSARAALMTRGYAEIKRLALALGARPETLSGLSGFGDLVLTCTSDKSRNFTYGRALGAGLAFDPSTTVEGAATARAVATLAAGKGIELPITAMVAAILDGHVSIAQAMEALLARPLKEE